MRKIITILFTVLIYFNAGGLNKYVDAVSGLDTNPGTLAAPYKTTTRVNAIFPTLNSGDSVLFRAGQTFPGFITIQKAGVIIASYGTGAKPIISNFTTLTLTLVSPNIYESQVLTNTQVNVVLVNGVMTAKGRFPQSTYNTFESFNGFVSITDNQLLNTPNWTGGEIVLRRRRFVLDRFPITNHSGTLITYSGGTSAPIAGYGYIIQNHINTLTYNGAWFYNTTTKRLRIYSNSGAPTVQVATADNVISCANFSNGKILNLAITGGNVAGISFTNGSGRTISGCTITFCQNGVDLFSSDVMSNDSVINNLNHGVNSNGGSNTLRTSYINRTGLMVGMGLSGSDSYTGVRMPQTGSLVEFNTIKNSGYSGNIINTISGTSISQNNFIDSFCSVKDDGAGIYTVVFGASKTILVRNNTVLHGIGANAGGGTGASQAYGIYIDNNSTAQVTGNNVAYTNGNFYFHGGSNCILRGNTSFNGGVWFNEQSVATTGNIFTSNKIASNTTTERVLRLSPNGANTINTWWTRWDSNYYARPLDDNLTMTNISTAVSLAMLKTAYPTWNVNSAKSPISATNANQVVFHYNETGVSKNVVLSGNWVDLTNAAYSGTISIPAYSSLILIATGTLITPTITWANPAAITYGTALSGTQLNATSGGVPGTFTYTPASGTILNAGTQTLSVLFTPTDGTTYTTATKNVTIVVNKANATMSYSNLTQTYNGLPLAPTITTVPSGLTTISTLYNGVGLTPTNAGVYAVTSALTNANYTAPNISGTFTINKETASLTVSNLSQTYNGSQKPITVVTSPVGLTGVAVTYDGSGTAPTNAGTYAVVVTLTNTNYSAPTVNTTLIISKATPTVTWANPSAITYGTALSGIQLNATASVAGTFTYTPASGAILNAGTQVLSVNFTPTDVANYNSVTNTTVDIVVNKAVATLTLNDLAQVYDGTQKVVTVTTNPVGLNTVTVTYNGSPAAPTNAGSYTISAALINSNYTATPASGTLVVSKADATLALSGLTVTYDGSAHAVTAVTSPLGLNTVSITYNGSATAPTNAGSYAIIASLSNANYQATNATGTLVISKAIPDITWNNPTAITYGTALSGTQLNATSSVAGTFVYTPASGTILNVGVGQILSVDFTPTDAANYFSVNDVTVSITVNKAVATLSLLNLTQEYDGNPKTVTVITTPSGLGTVSVTYNGSGTPPTAVGTYSIIATLTNTNYTATPATGNLVISSPVANVTITNILQTYTGSPLNVTVTVTGGYPYDLTYNGSVTPPTNVGSYVAIATINDGIHVGADTATFVIIKATPTISWSNPSAITFGTALNGTQLNASSATSGTYVYTPASGVILNVGTQILSVAFTPTDATNYNSTTATVSLVVNKATATITLSNLSQIYDGTQKFAIATTSPVGLDEVTITYDGGATAPSAVGSYAVSATLVNSNYDATPAVGTLVISASSAGISISDILQTYTGSPLPVTVTTNPIGLSHTVTYNASATVPTNAGSYTVIATLTGGTYTGADTQTLVISKATPVITWANPSDIVFGTALSGTQLNATANVAGSFVYSPISGTVLSAGNGQSLATTFTPTDAANYNVVSKIVTINVTGSTATLNLSGLTATYDGTQKPVIVTTTPTGLSGVVITYNGSLTVPTNAGNYTISVTLVNDNYTASGVGGTLVIAKRSPILTWATPTPIKVGTALTGAQLNATSSIVGTFTYNPNYGAILSAGTSRLVATFVPSDIVNYNITTISVALSVFGNPFLDHYLRHGNVDYQEIP